MEVVSTSNLDSSENENKQQLLIFEKAKSEPYMYAYMQTSSYS